MRTRLIILALLSVTVFAVILGLRAAGSLPYNPVTPIDSTPEQAPPVERGEGQVDAGALLSSATETVLAQGTALKEGPALLKRYCSKCHTVRSLERKEKSRSEWEKTLVQMEALGVHPEELEKTVLLDYLAGSAQP